MNPGTLVDLSHIVEDGMLTYPGLPGPVISVFLDRETSRAHYEGDTSFHIGRIEMVANTGTYVDAPFHRFEGGRDLAALPLDSVANVPGVVVPVRESTPAIDASAFEHVDVSGRAVLCCTGWSSRWRSEAYFEGHPHLTANAAQSLVERGARLVGIDSLNIDDTQDGRRPVHTTLLEHEIPIVEHLTNLDALPEEGFCFFAVPVKVRAFGTFPVRAFGLVD